MSLFKKPKKRMQMRILNVDDDDDENNSNKTVEVPPPPPIIKPETKKKDSKENKQKQVLLSFGDEGTVYRSNILETNRSLIYKYL